MFSKITGSIKIQSFFVVFILLLTACRTDQKVSVFGIPIQRGQQHHLVYQWAEKALEATAHDTELFSPRPTVTSRYLALTFIAMFDAWSRYDAEAIPVYLDGVERRPFADHTLRQKEIAISYAAYHSMMDYYRADSARFTAFFISLGFDPNNKSLNPDTPEGIGNLAAQAVILARKNDGSNQYGDEGESNGRPYFNYTSYTPLNTADKNNHIDRWQPKYFISLTGEKYAPGCLTPFWHNVKPVALTSGDMFRSPPPPLTGTPQLEKEIQEVVDLQAHLTDEQKAMVEFMRDGPASVQQAGHWLKFALNVSDRDHHTLDDDIKLFMLNQVAAMDAFIACWDTKMHYDFARPYALVHHYYQGKMIRGWKGPGHGWGEIRGEAWRPYSPDSFLCPAFPAYVSGHSTVSGACSEALKLFTQSDEFGEEITWIAGHLTEPELIGDTIILKLPTFSATAEMAGISRVLGGYHIQSDNLEGLALGRKVGKEVFAWYSKQIGH